MYYCKSGDKPRVEYTFNGKNKRIFQSQLAPINITTEQITKNDIGAGFNAEGYTIITADGGRITVHNYRTQKNNTEIQFWSCGNTDWDNRQPDGSLPIWYPLTSPIVSIDYSKKCPVPIKPSEYECVLKISYEGNQIYSDSGDCPLNFVVACGNCPNGYIECKTDAYPGYCCIPCNEIRNGIAAATSAIRGINRG